MKAEELRIGNLIGLDLKEFPENYFSVSEVANQSMKVSNNGQIHYFDSELMEGIPLTEDWLINFGFEKSVDNYGGWLIPIADDEKIRICNRGFGWEFPLFGNTPVKTEFVHTLQNLIFALTGQELTLAPPQR